MIEKIRENIKPIIVILVFSFFAVVITVIALQSGGLKVQEPGELTPTPRVPSNSFRQSALEKLIPGESTPEDAVSLLGQPDNQNTVGTKLYYSYDTDVEDIKDLLAFQNGELLYYGVENFFGDYIKSPSDFNNELGQPELVAFDVYDESIEWRIYPQKGIAVAVTPFENYVVKVLYFEPQTLISFESIFFPELGIIREKEVHEEEVIAPGFE